MQTCLKVYLWNWRIVYGRMRQYYPLTFFSVSMLRSVCVLNKQYKIPQYFFIQRHDYFSVAYSQSIV